MEATRHSYKDVVKSLLEKKANPNITEKVGLSTLTIILYIIVAVWLTSLSCSLSVPARVWKCI
jgi:hypothetical protein